MPNTARHLYRTLVYQTPDLGSLCGECATAWLKDADEGQEIVYWLHEKAEPMTCEHCHREIESAYGTE